MWSPKSVNKIPSQRNTNQNFCSPQACLQNICNQCNQESNQCWNHLLTTLTDLHLHLLMPRKYLNLHLISLRMFAGSFEFYFNQFGWKSKLLFVQLSWHEIVNHPLATSCKILVTSAKFLVALATRKAQFWTLTIMSKIMVSLTENKLNFPEDC